MRYFYALIIFIFLIPVHSESQTVNVGGKIIDAETAEPQAFVSISLKGHNRGAISDIDGKWNINSAEASDSLVFSIVGYAPVHTTVGGYQIKHPDGILKLYRTSYNLKEVLVRPGINPAHRIIQKAIDNKKKNNWERLPQWSYTTYCRFHVTNDVLDSAQMALEKERNAEKKKKVTIRIGGTAKKDSLKTKSAKDTLAQKESLDSFFEKQHLFLIESVTDKKFKYPDKVKETVIASKTSGSADPRFSLIFEETSNFNIYKDYIELEDKKYLSPLAYGSINKYLFILEDSIRSDKDTVYVISYRPRKNTLFDGFAGLLYISTQGYAVQNVTALPRNIDDGLNTEIQQQFTRINGKQWFPEQITTKIILGGELNNLTALVGKGKIYIKNVNLDPELSNKNFNSIAFDIDKNAVGKSDTFWNSQRSDSLSKKDKQTYKVIDSVGKAIHLDRKLKYFEALLSGRLGIGKFDIPLNRILDYNGYEGFRLGTGLYTNEKLSRFFSVGGYGAYGFHDRKWKYGGEAFITPIYGSPFTIAGGYYNDVMELGAVNFPMDRRPRALEAVHSLNIGRMFNYQREQASVKFSPFRYLMVEPMYKQSFEKINNFYFLKPDGELVSEFHFTEVSMGMRYAYKEKYMQLLDKRYSMGTHWPILWINLTQGLNGVGNGEYNYRRIDAKLEKTIPVKLVGHTNVQIRGGYVDGNVPLLRLFNGNGDRSNVLIASENIFETMRPYEFFSSKYASVFLTHSFEKLLFKHKHFQPVLNLHANAGIGTMDPALKALQQGIDFKTMDKGYYEAGLSINDIYKSLTGSFGVGAYYRLGSYMEAKPINNLMIKLVFSSGILGD